MEDFRIEDSRSEIYPQSGTDAVIDVVDIVTAATDGAAIADACSAVRTAAGRPQPPVAIAIAGFICALRIAVCSSLTLPRTVRTEVFV